MYGERRAKWDKQRQERTENEIGRFKSRTLPNKMGKVCARCTTELKHFMVNNNQEVECNRYSKYTKMAMLKPWLPLTELEKEIEPKPESSSSSKYLHIERSNGILYSLYTMYIVHPSNIYCGFVSLDVVWTISMCCMASRSFYLHRYSPDAVALYSSTKQNRKLLLYNEPQLQTINIRTYYSKYFIKDSPKMTMQNSD